MDKIKENVTKQLIAILKGDFVHRFEMWKRCKSVGPDGKLFKEYSGVIA